MVLGAERSAIDAMLAFVSFVARGSVNAGEIGMWTGRGYHMLIGSLPTLPRTFEVAHPPISESGLGERMRLLHPDDATVIERVADFFVWDRQQLDRTDQDVAAAYDDFMQSIHNRTARELVVFRLDLRTFVAALRLRRLGKLPTIGLGGWSDHVERNFHEPDLGLSGRYPWIVELDALLEGSDPLAMEHRLLELTWRRWSRLAERFTFGFEAVLLYLARWEILFRWTRHDAVKGRARFDDLLTEALGEYATPFA